ncbi:MAG: hypothetical protein EPN92_00420 [Chitinophagaceae bacterium]|nr:MAG: hypothetical protein EPN92_00420 [Chitinophagaceae bacterium]
MEQQQNTSSRKKFVLWGLGIISSVTALKLLFNGKKKKTTVKMLTEDGKLVEVDPDLIKKSGKKISNKEILTWVKNKPTL